MTREDHKTQDEPRPSMTDHQLGEAARARGEDPAFRDRIERIMDEHRELLDLLGQ